MTAGSYTVADITVDAKGRITAIASGSIPSGANGSWVELTLTNPNAETGDLTGWTQVGEGFTVESTAPSGHTMTPFEGTYSFLATPNADPEMYQDIDISSYATEIDAGELHARIEAFAGDTHNTGERPYIYAEFLDGSSNLVARLYRAR